MPTQIIQVKQNVVTLKGITLRGSIQLFNPHQTLAVIFEIECPRDFQFCFEPKRGIIMQKQIKTIKIWVKDEDRQRALMTNFLGKSIKINCTMKAQYNRKMMQKLNIRGWDQIQQTISFIEVPVVISTQARNIRSEIRQQASSSLHKISRDGSKQFSNGREQFKAGQSYIYGRGTPQLYRKKISDKLDRELDFLFENQGSRYGENVRYSGIKEPKIGNFQSYPMNGPIGDVVTYDKPNYKGDIVTYDQPFSNTPSINFNTNTPAKINYSSNSKQTNNQRFLQILMLAALAGFFAALGSNLKHLMS